MTQVYPKPQLSMKRTSLTDLPVIDLPDGYTYRSFNDGDDAYWEAIIQDSFNAQISFEQRLRPDPAFRPERVFFVCHDGIPVATASAWFRDNWGESTGYLHMVGIKQSHSGRGLGLQASLLALRYMSSHEGFDQCVLETDDFRIPAIRTYKKLGFVPNIVHPNQPLRWKKISEECKFELPWGRAVAGDQVFKIHNEQDWDVVHRIMNE